MQRSGVPERAIGANPISPSDVWFVLREKVDCSKCTMAICHNKAFGGRSDHLEFPLDKLPCKEGLIAFIEGNQATTYLY